MKNRWAAMALLLASGAAAETSASEALGFEAAAREALAASAAVARAAAQAGLAALEEPALLAETDTQLFGAYGRSTDRSPRHMPSFQGTYSKTETFRTGILQRTLTGMEASLAWDNQRLRNPSLARPLDPTADSRVSLEVRQPLLRYFWGRPDRARRGRFRAGAEAAANELLRVQTEVAVGVGKAYFQFYGAREAVEINRAAVKTAETLVRTYKEKRRYGLVEDSDLAQAEALLEAQRIEVNLAEAEADRAGNALAAALHRQGAAGADLPPLGGLPDLAVPAPDPSLAERAVTARPETRAASARRQAAEWAARTARLDALPDLAVTGGYAWAGLDRDYPGAWDDMKTGDHPVKSAGVSLTVPLLFRKERIARRSAEILAEAARREEAEAVQKVREDVRTAAAALSAARDRVAARERLMEIETRKLRAEEENFRRGRSSTDLIVRFQQDLSRARLLLVRARVEESAARLDWARSLGMVREVLGG
jgi:outer membrane protein TolC